LCGGEGQSRSALHTSKKSGCRKAAGEGYLADILYITPHLYPLPLRGEEHSGDLFSRQMWD